MSYVDVVKYAPKLSVKVVSLKRKHFIASKIILHCPAFYYLLFPCQWFISDLD